MRIKVENYLGQSLELNNNFPVIDVEGLTPAGATINTSTAGLADGTFFNSSYTNQRNIVLTVIPEGDPEEARLTLWKYFKPKYKCRLYFRTKTRNVYIDGYVESIEGTPYSAKASYQISIICPMPFFTDVNPASYDQNFVVDGFTFPVSIPEEGVVFGNSVRGEGINVYNYGEESTGVVITLRASGSVVNPRIYNRSNRDLMGLNISLNAGDTVEIDTRRGYKTIKLNGVNAINSLTSESEWIALDQGENIFTYTAEYGDFNLDVTYTVYTLYEGL